VRIFHPTSSARTLSWPVCPNCTTPMLIARIDPNGPGTDRRTFECTNCDHSEIEIVNYADKYNIDPEHIEAMRAAFHRLCGILQLDGDPDDPMTEITVMKIVALAKAEELDPERLCIAVLAALDDDAARAHAAAGSPAPPL
jgi:hypothetical protein